MVEASCCGKSNLKFAVNPTLQPGTRKEARLREPASSLRKVSAVPFQEAMQLALLLEDAHPHLAGGPGRLRHLCPLL